MGERKSLPQHEPRISIPSRLTDLSTPVEFTEKKLRGQLAAKIHAQIDGLESLAGQLVRVNRASFQAYASRGLVNHLLSQCVIKATSGTIFVAGPAALGTANPLRTLWKFIKHCYIPI